MSTNCKKFSKTSSASDEYNIEYTVDLKNHKPKTISRTEFIDLVHTQQQIISIRYDENTKVKPFFDFDHISDQEFLFNIDPIIDVLNKEFNGSNIAIATNHRLIGMNKFKHSFHFIINGYTTTISDLRKLVNHWKHNNIVNFDINVYQKKQNTTKIFRFSNQAKENQLTLPIINQEIEAYIIIATTGNTTSYQCPYSEISKKNTQIKRNNTNIIPHFVSQHQLKLYQTLLNQLPLKFTEETKYWAAIGYALSNCSNGNQNMLQLWIDFSKRCT